MRVSSSRGRSMSMLTSSIDLGSSTSMTTVLMAGYLSEIDQLFTQLGIAMSYGSWANIYICNFRLSALDQSVTLGGPERSAVCR